MPNFYIANVANVPTDKQTAVTGALNILFTRIAAGQMNVSWITSATGVNITDTDLLVYVVSSYSYSLIKHFPTNPTIDPTSNGLTAFQTNPKKAASEVYLDSCLNDTDLLAKLIFHESMHNKLLMGNEMHDKSGGLAQETISASTQLSSADIQRWKSNWNKKVNQWPEGFGFIPAPGDPLAGIL
ncbi:MAG: hypothetical protein JST47_13340 [Bacteroidetes bacterium]|nr:hypothetical protein [Bacteroidota bacterium]MBS1975244.1 hypothetical protein [Bacteroidota bacterium]